MVHDVISYINVKGENFSLETRILVYQGESHRVPFVWKTVRFNHGRLLIFYDLLSFYTSFVIP